ncbi:hypothetical protein EP7_000987 [Isosphaeraceae bacterium EP7]
MDVAMGLPESHSLHRMFRGLTESTFLDELGIGDPGLVGYVSGLLARFVAASALWSIRDASGTRLTEVAHMLLEAESTDDLDRRRECHQHVGDYALFWTGVYPEALARKRPPGSVDGLINFQRQGKHSYYVASTLDGERAPVLRRLSDEFELCAFGLSRVRREWERHEGRPHRGPLLAG